MLKKVVIGFGLFAVITILLGWAAVLVLESRAEKELESARQKLRDLGAPMSIKDLTLPTVPDDQNAALLFMEAEAFDNYSNNLSESEDIVLWGSIDPDYDTNLNLREQDNAVIETVRNVFNSEKVVKFLKFYEEASQRPYYQRKLNIDKESEYFKNVIPNVGGVMRATRLLSQRGKLHFLEGDNEAGLNDLRIMAAIAAHMAREKFLVSQLTSIAVTGILIADIWELDRYYKLTTTELSDLKGILSIAAPSNKLIDSLDSERVYILNKLYEYIYTGEAEELANFASSHTPLAFYFSDSLLEWHFINDHALFLSWSAALRELYALPYWKAAPLMDGFDEEWIARAEEGHLIISQLLIAPANNIYKYVAITETQTLLAQVGLSLSQYYIDHTQYPQELDSLIPDYLTESPIDPLTGGEFIYSKTNDGYMLYSIGLNGIDDKATTDTDGLASKREGDLVWKGRNSIFTDRTLE